ncbi:ZHX2 protein, partial [Polyodon spathula]|nr:ZHX2 protein [Polyodon spathula]
MASRRKSTIPCMVRATEMVEQDDPDEMEVIGDTMVENGSPKPLSNDDWTTGNGVQSKQKDVEQDKPATDTPQPRKPQGGYECKYCPYSTQNLNEFTEHVDSNHPNVILNPLYVCAECNFNTKKYDTLSEHNMKCHPGESNFKLKLIKRNSQTILEQTIEGANSTAGKISGENITPVISVNKTPMMKIGKPDMDTKRLPRKGDDLQNLSENLSLEMFTDPIPTINVNGTIIIPNTSVPEGLTHVMPSLQRPPNYNLVPKIAVPLNTTKYNPSLDINMTLINSFNKFPYPTQAELSWLTAASKHPEEQIRVWFIAQRLKRGISWSPEEVEEARKKMFNGTIQPVTQTLTVLPAQLARNSKVTQPLLRTLPCQILGQTSLVLTQVTNGSTMTYSPITMTMSDQVQPLKRPLPAPVVTPEAKRASVGHVVQSHLSPATPIISPMDRKKTREQISELKASFLKSQFPEDKEVYRLIEATGLSRGEIKKWFSDHRYRTQRGIVNITTESVAKDMAQRSSRPQSPCIHTTQQKFKGNTLEQLKVLEANFQKTSIPTQAEVDRLMVDTSLSRNEIDNWFLERRIVRDNMEQALLNSMDSHKKEDQQQPGALNGTHRQGDQVRASPLPTVASIPLEQKTLDLLKGVFAQTLWPSPEEYDQLALKTGMARTEIVRWFMENRSALKRGSLQWMEQYQKLNGEGRNGQSQTTLGSKSDHSVLQQHYQEFKELREDDLEKLVEGSKLSYQEIRDWFANKQGEDKFDRAGSVGQGRQSSEEQGDWVEVTVGVDEDEDHASDCTESGYEMVEDDSEGMTG